MELGKDSNKGLGQRLSAPTDLSEPMDTDTDAPAGKEPTNKTKDRKSTKAATSNFSQSFPSRVPCVDIKQEKATKDGDAGKEDNKKQDFKKTLTNESKTELKSVKGGTKSQKTEVCPTTKPCRPSSTPPSEAGKMEPAPPLRLCSSLTCVNIPVTHACLWSSKTQ